MMKSELFLDGRVALYSGDCLSILETFSSTSYDACVTDPPYALVSIGKRFGAANAVPAKGGKTGVYARASAGFMGKKWDTGSIVFDPDFWRIMLRLLKPGAHLLAFGGTRTYHRLACAIEDSGFEIRDAIMWHYGSGFPKSRNMSGNWKGWGTALKPATEIIVVARKPLSESTIAANVLRWGTGALNIDGCRVGITKSVPASPSRTPNNIYGSGMTSLSGGTESSGFDPNIGRWPANLVHDGSEEVLAAFPETSSGLLQTHHKMAESANVAMSGKNYARQPNQDSFGDSGSAARFFYTAKADSNDRLGSKHPTVKPVALMQWLIRLVTPKNGFVIDPFAGSGTTGEAAFRERIKATLVEKDEEYIIDIRRRMKLCLAGPDERTRESIKALGKLDNNPGPLFGAEE